MGGCAFGKVTREKVDNIHERIVEIKCQLDNMDAKITDLFNHQSNRLPPWATILFTVGGSLIAALGTWIITH
jgi:hypothetical protein